MPMYNIYIFYRQQFVQFQGFVLILDKYFDCYVSIWLFIVKVYFYNYYMLKRAAEQLSNGMILNQVRSWYSYWTGSSEQIAHM